ncbi:MAG: DUF2079 domain-containing protein, partial [Candidatus Omnitrophica bacterium]|nr:DUF2079 domain-containing protein [Candidatus Omnitrophota bacterium]
MNAIERFCKEQSDKLIWVLIGAYVILFSCLSALKYYSFNYYDWDLASDVAILWNSVHGRLLYYPFLQQNIFGAHLCPVIFFIIPIYAVFQHPMTVLFLQSLFLGLAAYPLYLFARSQLNKVLALGIGLAYLLYPSVGFINLFESHFEVYEIFFLFFALFYFEKENFKKFLLFLLLALTCKENVSMVVFMFGIYALVRRRPWIWVMVPSLLGLFWFFISVKMVIPYFARDAALYQEGFIFSAYYQHLGTSILEMLKTIILHPVTVLKFALTPGKVLYIFSLFIPTAFIGLASPAVLLMTLPIFMQNLLSSAFTHSQITYQYVALLIPFIFASAVFALKKFSRHAKALLLLLILTTIAAGIRLEAPQLFFSRYLRDCRITDLARAKSQLVKRI